MDNETMMFSDEELQALVERTLTTPLDLDDDENPGAKNIRGYLLKILETAYLDNEFTSKRPFGYSFWQGYLHLALVKNGMLSGTIDEDGYLQSLESGQAEIADVLLMESIRSLGNYENDVVE